MNVFIAYTCDDDLFTTVTFLYQLVKGQAKRSYGLNVARLANLPNELLRLATRKSQALEEQVNKNRRDVTVFQALCSASREEMMDILHELIQV